MLGAPPTPRCKHAPPGAQQHSGRARWRGAAVVPSRQHDPGAPRKSRPNGRGPRPSPALPGPRSVAQRPEALHPDRHRRHHLRQGQLRRRINPKPYTTLDQHARFLYAMQSAARRDPRAQAVGGALSTTRRSCPTSRDAPTTARSRSRRLLISNAWQVPPARAACTGAGLVGYSSMPTYRSPGSRRTRSTTPGESCSSSSRTSVRLRV